MSKAACIPYTSRFLAYLHACDTSLSATVTIMVGENRPLNRELAGGRWQFHEAQQNLGGRIDQYQLYQMKIEARQDLIGRR